MRVLFSAHPKVPTEDAAPLWPDFIEFGGKTYAKNNSVTDTCWAAYCPLDTPEQTGDLQLLVLYFSYPTAFVVGEVYFSQAEIAAKEYDPDARAAMFKRIADACNFTPPAQ